RSAGAARCAPAAGTTPRCRLCSAVQPDVALLLAHRDHEPFLRGLRRRVTAVACGRGRQVGPGPETTQTAGNLCCSAATAANTAPKPLDNACPGGQLWNVGPAHRPQRTVLDDLPKPTDQKAVRVPIRARSVNQWYWWLIAIAPGGSLLVRGNE